MFSRPKKGLCHTLVTEIRKVHYPKSTCPLDYHTDQPGCRGYLSFVEVLAPFEAVNPNLQVFLFHGGKVVRRQFFLRIVLIHMVLIDPFSSPILLLFKQLFEISLELFDFLLQFLDFYSLLLPVQIMCKILCEYLNVWINQCQVNCHRLLHQKVILPDRSLCRFLDTPYILHQIEANGDEFTQRAKCFLALFVCHRLLLLMLNLHPLLMLLYLDFLF